MKFSTLMIIKAVVCLAFGVVILAAPEFLYSIFGISLSPGGAVAGRQYGASLIAGLMITWFARNVPVSDARWAIALGYCVYDGIGFVITLAAVLSGVMNPLSWLIVALYLFLALGFGYFAVKREQPVLQVKTA